MAATAAVALAASAGAAFAGPVATNTINGVTFPIGLSADGNQIQGTYVWESPLITAPGQELSGIGYVTSILPAGSSTPVWTNGNHNTELAFYFSGLVSKTVVAPTPTTNGSLTFTGGTLTFYTLAGGTDILGNGSIAADIAVVTGGKLWLSEKFAPTIVGSNVTLSSTIYGGSLTEFENAGGAGYLDVTGGPAGPDFATHTFSNPADATGFSDQTFNSSFNTASPSEFPISGTTNIKANAIPEPATLSLLGAGLLGLGAAVRRRRG